MEMVSFSSGSCCHRNFKNSKKRRERDVEIPWNGSSKLEGPWNGSGKPGHPWNGSGRPENPWNVSGKPKCYFKCGCSSIQVFPSGSHHAESSSAYLIWPPAARHNGSAEERAAYFGGLQKAAEVGRDQLMPGGHQATTLLDLMTIRAIHTKALRRYSLGTALGFRTRGGILTNIPAIIVFVGRKVHKEWLLDAQKLPSALEGPGGVWCDVDVVEFSYYGSPPIAPKEHLYTELVEGLRGNDPYIGAGSQVASQETYGTLGGIVRSRTSGHQLGFLTNRHVAVDLDYPNQKMFHPLPPSLGPGVYLGAVERATSFITDDLWYGVFAGMNSETFVRADGAFIPFSETFDLSKVTANLKGVGEMGEVMRADLQAPIDSIIGRHVMKVGRSSGLTKGLIMAYAVEYNDERGICYFTDFLIVGENGQPFDLEGDSGSLILLTGEEYEKPRPIGIIWGGTANRGRLKLRSGHGPENWTSGVDLGRLLDLLQLELITSNSRLSAAIEEHPDHQLRQGRVEAGFPLPDLRDVRISVGEEHERRVEKAEGSASLDDKSLDDEEAFETVETETPDGVQHQHKTLEHQGAVPGVPGEDGVQPTSKFAGPESEDSGDEGDFSLSLGATAHGWLSAIDLQGNGIVQDPSTLGVAVEDRDSKRRRLTRRGVRCLTSKSS